VAPPPLAVMVSEYVPAAALLASVSFKMLVPVPEAPTLESANDAVTRLGAPVTENEIAALNPVPALVVSVNGSRHACGFRLSAAVSRDSQRERSDRSGC
jgi:hypothetical protein